MSHTEDEIALERKRRINVAVWAYAYEYDNDPIVGDELYDKECRLIDTSIITGNTEMDTFFREKFTPHTGMWVHEHPHKDRLKKIADLKRRGK